MIDISRLSAAEAVRLHQRLQKVEIGTGVAEHLSEIYAVTAELDDCFAYTKAEMGVYDDD